MNYIIDSDEKLKYETNSPIKKATNSVLIPVLNSLPTVMRKYLKKTHKAGKEIIEHATTHKALEILYGYGSAKAKGNAVQNFFNSIWLSTNNAKAVRNRLRLVKREIRNEIIKLAESGREIKIASIASGSARAITESITEASIGKKVSIKTTFVDKNQSALEYSQKLAAGHERLGSFQWINDTAGNFFRVHAKDEKFNIIEMVGLMDYFQDEKAVELFRLIRGALAEGGMFITANIGDNKEKEFITRVLGWKMIYRTADEFSSLLLAAGFALDKMKVYYEPQRIHCVIVAQK
jgi:hypothetical protein